MSENSQTMPDSRRRIATLLGLNPSTPDSWPLTMIDRLIELEKYEGKEKC